MIEHEKALIGVVYEDFEKCACITDLLEPEYFQDDFCRDVFKICVELVKEGIGVDSTSIITAGIKKGLFENNLGDYAETMIIEMNNWAEHCFPHHWKNYTNGIVKSYVENKAPSVLLELSKTDFVVKDIAQELLKAKTVLMELSSVLEITHKHTKDDAGSILEDMYINEDTRDRVKISTGYKSLDKILKGGFKKSELVILAARPGMGKSAFAMNMALNMAKNNTPTALISLEMSKEDILGRVMNMERGFDYDNLSEANGFGVWHDEISKLKFFINDSAQITIGQLRSYVSGKVDTEGLKVLFVDYLQLITGDGGSIYEKVSSISRGLKMISREFNITIVALAQLNRKVEERADRVPFTSDLRDSGAIEQDADRIIMMSRPGQHDPLVDKKVCNIYIRKNRDGELGDIQLNFNGGRMKFSEPVGFL